MDYKDLMKKYKVNQVTDEEKQFIEKEIEKYEAMEEYFSENLDDELGNLENIDDAKQNSHETVQLKKSVDQRLRKVILKSVLIAMGVWISIFYILSPLVDPFFYNPQKFSVGELDNDVSFDLAAVTELNMPGMSPSTVFVDRKGFGVYHLTYSYLDQFRGDFHDVSHVIRCGKIASTRQDLLLRFDPFENLRYYNDQKDILKDLNENAMADVEILNPVSYGSFSISFEEDLTLEELARLEEKYENIQFQWAAIRAGEKDEERIEKLGMRLMGNRLMGALTGDEKIGEKYPAFSTMNWLVNNQVDVTDPANMAEGYEQHYFSLLEYVIDRGDNLEILEQRENKTILYKEALEYAKKEGIRIYGLVVYSEMRHIREFTENENLRLFDLNDAVAYKRY